MADFRRAISAGFGALAETAADQERAQLEARHQAARDRTRQQYRQAERAEERAFKTKQAQEAVRGREEAATLKFEREKELIGEREKTKARFRQPTTADTPADIIKTEAIFDRLQRLRPAENTDALWIEAYNRATKKKTLTPDAEVRAFYSQTYRSLAQDAFTEEEFAAAEDRAQQMADAYRQRFFGEEAAPEPTTPAEPQAFGRGLPIPEGWTVRVR